MQFQIILLNIRCQIIKKIKHLIRNRLRMKLVTRCPRARGV